jgi:hypothetical protein
MKKLRDIVPKKNLLFLSIKKGKVNIREKYEAVKTIQGAGSLHHYENNRKADTRPSTKLIGHYQKSLSEEQVNSIQHYANDGYKDINTSLFHKARNPKHDIHPDVDKHVQHMDNAMKVKKTPYDMKVFSGIQDHPMRGYNAQLSENGSLHAHLPAFTSTSISHNVARSMAYFKKRDENGETVSHMIKIHVPKGSNGHYVEHLARMGSDEKEFILPRNSQIKIHPTPHVITRKYYNKRKGEELTHKYHIWHARLVHDGEKEV